MAWHVIQCRPHGHTGVVGFCVSYNNGGGEIRPQARSADGLVRKCLGAGGSLCCFSGRCPATGRRPPVPAEPLKGAADGERESCPVHRPGWGRRKQRIGSWGRSCLGPEATERERALGTSPFPEEPDLVLALAQHGTT